MKGHPSQDLYEALAELIIEQHETAEQRARLLDTVAFGAPLAIPEVCRLIHRKLLTRMLCEGRF